MALYGADGEKAKPMPHWHQDVNPRSLMQWNGHWFKFEGIDPNHDENVIFFRYKEPTKSTKRRNDASRT